MVSIVELAIGFFIQIPCPGRTSMKKVDIGRQSLRDIMVLGELRSIVIGDIEFGAEYLHIFVIL